MKNHILLLFLAVHTFAYSQHSLEGTVKEEGNNFPVIGATVYIPKLEKGSITDLHGNFRLEGLSPGIYELVISSMGYSTVTLKVELPEENGLEIMIAPSAIEMEEVIISTPFHQLQSENVMKVERATMEDLRQTGAINLAEGITKMAGVESISTGSGIGKPVIRGLSSNRVLVYTQGVRLENQQFGGEHGLGISSSGIESVEVIKGPASLLYGSDALGGVLYLNPEKYAVADSTEVDAGIGYHSNTQGYEAEAGFKTSGNKLKFLVRGNYNTHSDYETGEGDRVNNSRFHGADLKTGIGYRTQGYKADLRYNLNSKEVGIPTGLGNSVSKELLEPYQEVQNHVLSLDNTFYLDNSSLDLKLGYSFNDRKEFEEHHHHEHATFQPHGLLKSARRHSGASLVKEKSVQAQNDLHQEEPAHGEEAALWMQLRTLSYDAKYHLPNAGAFETIIGVQGMYQNNHNKGEEFLIPDAHTSDVGVMATTHLHLKTLDFQAGLRYDNRQISSDRMQKSANEVLNAVDRSFNSFNGAIGMKLDLLPELDARLNFATGFRAPNLAELTSLGSHHGSNRYEIGNSELTNEQNYQLDLALEYRNEHLEVFGNAFYNNISDYIYLNPTGEITEDNPVYRYVQNNASLYGGEAGFHLHPHPIHWLHFLSSYEMVIGKQENGEYLPLIPAHSVLNTLRLEFDEFSGLYDGYGFISLKSVFDQDRVNLHEEPTGGYSLLDAGVGGNFIWNDTEFGLQVSANNLLNKTYVSHLSRLKPDGIANMGRNISVSLRIHL